MNRLLCLVIVLASVGILTAGVVDPTSDLAKPGSQVLGPAKTPDGGTDDINWATKADAPTPGRYWAPGTGAVRDTIYILGGRVDYGGGNTNSTREIIAYVPAEDTWLQSGLPTLGTPRRAGAGGAIGNKVYACGGRDSIHTTLNTAEYLDCDSMVVRSIASMPGGCWSCAGAVAGGKLYVIGDENRTGTTYEYDPGTNSWSTKTPCPVGRGWTAAAGAAGKVYLFGGSGTGDLQDCWEYDPTTDGWTQKADMPGTRSYHYAVPFNDSKIFVIGGSVDGSQACDGLVYVYDVAANSWTVETTMPTPRGWEMAAQVGDRLYVMCGSDASTPTYLLTNEEAQPIFPDHDVGVASIAPLGRILPDTMLPYKATVSNNGLNPETFDATMVVCDTATGDTLLNADTTLTLAAGLSEEVEFGQLSVALEDVVQLTAFVYLPGDENPANDTMVGLAEARIGSMPDGFGYVYQSTQEPDTLTHAWWDYAGGTPITDWQPNSDDGYSTQTLPFTFRYYDQNLSTINICTNGFLETSTMTTYSNGDIPYSSIQNLMAGWWDDLDPGSGGTVYRHTVTTDRDWVVFSWVNVPRYATSENQTFQIGLSEDGIIRYNYSSMNGTLNSNTIGIQGLAGTSNWFHRYVYNGDPANHIVDDGVSIAFYYPPYLGVSNERERVAEGTRLRLPNPFTRRAIDVSERLGTGSLEFYSLTGRRVKTVSLDGKARSVSLADLGEGVYFVRLMTESCQEVSKLVVVE